MYTLSVGTILIYVSVFGRRNVTINRQTFARQVKLCIVIPRIYTCTKCYQCTQSSTHR